MIVLCNVSSRDLQWNPEAGSRDLLTKVEEEERGGRLGEAGDAEVLHVADDVPRRPAGRAAMAIDVSELHCS